MQLCHGPFPAYTAHTRGTPSNPAPSPYRFERRQRILLRLGRCRTGRGSRPDRLVRYCLSAARDGQVSHGWASILTSSNPSVCEAGAAVSTAVAVAVAVADGMRWPSTATSPLADGAAAYAGGPKLAGGAGAGPDRSSSAPNAPRALSPAAIRNRSSIAPMNTCSWVRW
jgi:hypothetical protein